MDKVEEDNKTREKNEMVEAERKGDTKPVQGEGIGERDHGEGRRLRGGHQRDQRHCNGVAGCRVGKEGKRRPRDVVVEQGSTTGGKGEERSEETVRWGKR